MSKFDDWIWEGLKYFALILFILVGFPGIYFWVNYLDETITDGEGYGFTIGENKQITFSRGKKLFESAYIIYPLDKQNFGPLRNIEFEEEDFLLIRDRDMWRFYFEGDNYSNVLRLRFNEKGELISIYRHNQPFELP